MILQPEVAYKRYAPVWYYPEGYGVGEKIEAKVTSDENDGEYDHQDGNMKTYTLEILKKDASVVLKDGELVKESYLTHR